MSDEHPHHPNYWKIYFVLMVLFIISVTGPLIGIKWITLLTAFGIAVVKAYLVVKNFMHITAAPSYITYLSATCLVFMLLFFAGTAPDVMKEEGTGWEKPDWLAESAEAAAGGPKDHDDHGDGHH